MKSLKKLCAAVLAASLTISVFAGCGASNEASARADNTSKKRTIDDILAESKAKQSSDEGAVNDYPALDKTADVDLTTLGSNMVYSTVFGMMNTPDEYINKTVKAGGTFDVITDIKTNKMYYFCVVADAKACCSQGLEFVCKDDLKYPDDFPKVGEPVTVCGAFGTYEEDGKTYYALLDAEFSP